MAKKSGRSIHHGRVTSRRPENVEHDPPVPSGRYTPPTPKYRLRPRWHRIAGWLGVLAGALIAIANDAMLFSESLTLLPGGHQELYLMLGLAVAGSSTWFLGLFDRGTTIFE